MGAAKDPDVDDYYNKSREFPLTYSPEEDPEVIEEMWVTVAELERGENDSKGKEDGNESDESSASGGSSSEDDGPEEGWEDDDDKDGLASTGGQSKRTKGAKTMSVIDKVRTVDFCVFPCMLIWPYSSMRSLLTCFDLKLSARKSVTSFENSVRPNTTISSPFAA